MIRTDKAVVTLSSEMEGVVFSIATFGDQCRTSRMVGTPGEPGFSARCLSVFERITQRYWPTTGCQQSFDFRTQVQALERPRGVLYTMTAGQLNINRRLCRPWDTPCCEKEERAITRGEDKWGLTFIPGTGVAFEDPPEAFLATNPNLAYGGTRSHDFFRALQASRKDGTALHGGLRHLSCS